MELEESFFYVDTRLLTKLLTREGEVCGYTLNEEVMDVEEGYGC